MERAAAEIAAAVAVAQQPREEVVVAQQGMSTAGGAPLVAAAAEATVAVAQQPQEEKQEEVVAAQQGMAAADGAPLVGAGQVKSKACHQCRKMMELQLMASCNNLKKTKPCPLMYCRKCMLRRYNEGAEEVARNGWICPKCRINCNCSQCMRNQGKTPTGILYPVAKASGHTSVNDLLKKGSDAVAEVQQTRKEPTKPKRARGLGDAKTGVLAEGDKNTNRDASSSVPVKKVKETRHTTNEIVLPRGTPVCSVAGAELEPEDIGSAVQFYEFCHSFTEIFQLRKGQAERIIQDIAGGRGLRVVSSHIAEFHINLLNIIQECRGMRRVTYSRDEDAWIFDIGKYISESFLSKEFDLGSLNQGMPGYKSLSPSSKLLILNFLCDEALCTEKFRNFMPAGTKYAAKKKAKELIELQNNMAEATLLEIDGATITAQGNANGISQIKEANDVKDTSINEKNLRSLRIKPVLSNSEKGLAYWKLDGCCNNASILLQEVDTDDLTRSKDKWFMFTENEDKLIEDFASKGE